MSPISAFFRLTLFPLLVVGITSCSIPASAPMLAPAPDFSKPATDLNTEGNAIDATAKAALSVWNALKEAMKNPSATQPYNQVAPTIIPLAAATTQAAQSSQDAHTKTMTDFHFIVNVTNNYVGSANAVQKDDGAVREENASIKTTDWTKIILGIIAAFCIAGGVAAEIYFGFMLATTGPTNFHMAVLGGILIVFGGTLGFIAMYMKQIEWILASAVGAFMLSLIGYLIYQWIHNHGKATSIVKSFEAVEQKGQMILTDAAKQTLNAVQTPAAKAFVQSVTAKVEGEFLPKDPTVAGAKA